MHRIRGVRRIRPLAITTLLLLPLATAPIAAATDEDGFDQRFEPWLGCWQPVDEPAEDISPLDTFENVDGAKSPAVDTRQGDTEQSAGDSAGPEPQTTLCVDPEETGSGVMLTTLVDGEVVHREVLRADGAELPMERGECKGTRTARWSADGHRLFLDAALRCGDATQSLSGVSLIEGDRWSDIQVIDTEEDHQMMVATYQRVEHPVEVATTQEASTRPSATVRARLAHRGPLTVDDVIEASQHLDEAALEAALLESGGPFRLDAATLVRLSNAGVSEHIIDLMVALTFPDRFVVERSGATYRREPVAAGIASTYSIYPDATFFYFGAPFYDYYYPRHHFYYYPSGPSHRQQGRVVKGRGYTRVSPRGGTGDAKGRGSSDSSSGGSSGRASSSGYSHGGSSHSSGSSGRTAVPRGDRH